MRKTSCLQLLPSLGFLSLQEAKEYRSAHIARRSSNSQAKTVQGQAVPQAGDNASGGIGIGYVLAELGHIIPACTCCAQHPNHDEIETDPAATALEVIQHYRVSVDLPSGTSRLIWAERSILNLASCSMHLAATFRPWGRHGTHKCVVSMPEPDLLVQGRGLLRPRTHNIALLL